MTGLEFALVMVGAVLFDLALACVLAAALTGRRPSDRRAVREWEATRKALARKPRNETAQPNPAERPGFGDPACK